MRTYDDLTRVYLDIETTGLDPQTDRVTMIGLMNESGESTILTNRSEQALLKEFAFFIKKRPHLLIGHNLFEFDLPFLATRMKRHGVRHPFRRSQKTARISSASFHGKPIEFTPVYWPKVDIVDTLHQVAIWDKQAAKLSSYSLKNSVIALGLRDGRRLELSAGEIRECWETDNIEPLKEYLIYDLEDTQRLADFLLPVVWGQMAWVPGISFQRLAIASPALKAQHIHQGLMPRANVQTQDPIKYDGGLVELISPGLHDNVAKIDVSSLYPSIMLRYGVCSKKDRDMRFLGVMQRMTQERLRLKTLAKQGEPSAKFQEKALKILINGSYGFMGTGGYSFNDYEAAALVTACGRKILTLMMDKVREFDGVLIEVDTDGILFSHRDPEFITKQVQSVLPKGINIELELQSCGIYAPKAKSYVIVHPNGKTTIKGLFRKRDRYPLEREFPVTFLQHWFKDSPEVAKDYYRQVRKSIEQRTISVEQLTVTRKISVSEKRLIELGLGKAGDRVSYWIGCEARRHKTSGKFLGYQKRETQADDYWIEHYLDAVDKLYQDITGEPPDITELPLFKTA